MINIPKTNGYQMRNIAYLPYYSEKGKPNRPTNGAAWAWMSVLCESLKINTVEPDVLNTWYDSMVTTQYTYNKGVAESHEAVLTICDTGGGAFTINDPSGGLGNALISTRSSNTISPDCPRSHGTPGGYMYGTEKDPFPECNLSLVDQHVDLPAITLPPSPNSLWPGKFPGAIIGWICGPGVYNIRFRFTTFYTI